MPSFLIQLEGEKQESLRHDNVINISNGVAELVKSVAGLLGGVATIAQEPEPERIPQKKKDKDSRPKTSKTTLPSARGRTGVILGIINKRTDTFNIHEVKNLVENNYPWITLSERQVSAILRRLHKDRKIRQVAKGGPKKSAIYAARLGKLNLR